MNTDEMKAMLTKAPKPLPRTIVEMHKVYGRGEGTCGECVNFDVVPVNRGGRRAFKCWRFGTSQSAATDWRRSWPACGLKDDDE